MRSAQPGPALDRGPSRPPIMGAPQQPSILSAQRANPLGTFLRAHRERTKPEQAGLPVSGRRRVSGLRREELAMLARISADYYLRLERGRDRHPSRQVLDSLASVLRFDEDHTAHLHALALPPPARTHTLSTSVLIPPSTRELLHALPHPAFIEDRYFTIVAANTQATALNPRMAPGQNQLRDLLLNDAEQAMHPDAHLAAACLIASLRHTIGNEVADPQFIQLTDELHERSERFRSLWADHNVQSQRGARLTLLHPRSGSLLFNREQLTLNTTSQLKLVIYSPSSPH